MPRGKVWNKRRILRELTRLYDESSELSDKRQLMASIAAIISKDTVTSAPSFAFTYSLRPTCDRCGAPYVSSCSCATTGSGPQGSVRGTQAPPPGS